MRLGLPPHVHLALSGSRAIFLDTQHDRYKAVSLSSGLQSILVGRSAADDGDRLCRDLVGLNLLVPLDDQARPLRPAEIEIASRSILETSRGRGAFSSRTIVAIGRSLRRTTTGLRQYGLALTLDRLRWRKEAGAVRADPDLACEIALTFATHRALLPQKRICLRDSLALLDLLGRQGCSADLIFAVQAEPFYAHCWLQAGCWILNDSGYFPQTLSPILRL